jgi:hypothetical protein
VKPGPKRRLGRGGWCSAMICASPFQWSLVWHAGHLDAPSKVPSAAATVFLQGDARKQPCDIVRLHTYASLSL